MNSKAFLSGYSNAVLTGHVFELLHCGEDRRLRVLQEEDDQQCQSVVVEKGTSTTGVTCTQSTVCVCDRMRPGLQGHEKCLYRMKSFCWGLYSTSLDLLIPKR